MSFKNYNIKFITRSLMLFAMATTVSCSEFLNGQKEKEVIIEVEDSSLNCLKNIPDVFIRYLDSHAGTAEIRSSSKCMQQALTYFSLRTKGSKEDAYTVEDIRKFFGKYFLKERNLTESLIHELMTIKSAIFGGSSDTISKPELARITIFISLLENEMIELKPHVAVLLFKKDSPVDWSEIDSALAALKSNLKNLFINSDLVKSDYGIEDARRLMIELVNFLDERETFKYFTFFESVKNVLLGQRSELHGIRDWTYATDDMINLYSLYLKYQYKLKGIELQNPNGISVLSRIMNDTLSLIENCYQIKKLGRISFEDIDKVIDQAAKEYNSLGPIKPESLKAAYKSVLLYMLDSVRHGDSRGFDSLERQHLLSLRREYNIWKVEQKFIDSYLKSDIKISRKEVVRLHKEYYQKYSSSDSSEGSTIRQFRDEIKEFEYLISKDKAISFTENGRISLSQYEKNHKINWMSVTVTNLIRSINRLFQFGYGEGAANDILKSTITQKSLARFFENFDLIGNDLTAFDPRNRDSSARSFKEANFFTPSGNGDDRMDYSETFEFLSFMFTVGLGSSSDFEKNLIANKCFMSDVDVFGLPWMDANCLKRTLRSSFSRLLVNLPEHVKYVSNLNDDGWNQYFDALLEAGKISENITGKIETSEFRAMLMMIHYVESLFVTFDTDQSDNLSLSELKAASERFMGFIRDLSPIKNDTVVRNVFLYIAYTGKRPTGWQLTGFEMRKISGSLGSIDRTQLLKVFASLKKEIKK